MKQLTGTNVQECTASQISTAVSKPCDGLASTVTIDSSQPTTFLFSLASVSGYDTNADGSLVIHFKDTSSLTIPNFKQLADANYTAKLEDGTTIEFAKMMDDIAADTAEKTAAMKLDFASDDVKAVVAEDGKLTITLKDGSVRVINYDESQEPVLTFADGKSVLPSDLVHQYDIAEAKAADDLAKTEPAAGETQHKAEAKQVAAADTAEALAAVEPAAGAAAGGVGNSGAGFGSRIDNATIGPVDDVGPIGPTSLAFGLPAPDEDVPLAIVAAVPPSIVVFPNPPVANATDTPTNEDTSVTLIVNGEPSVTDGSEFITVQIVGIPSTWTVTNLNGGVYDVTTGTWTIQMPPGATFTGGPTILPPSNSDVDLPLTLIVTTTNTTTNLSTSTTDNFQVVVDAVVDTPTVTVTNTTVAEDNVAPINIGAAVTDPDGSESVTQVTITGVPAGFTLSAGTFNAGTNTWTLTGAQLAGLTMSSPANYSGTVNLSATITVFDNPTDGELTLTNNTYTTTVPVAVTWTPVADAPVLSAGVAQVYEDGSVTLATTATLVDRDGSESMTVEIVGIPSTWTITNLNGGTYNAATQTWSITLAAGADFAGGPRISPPANSDIDLPLTLRATTTDGTDTATSTTPFTVVVDAVADGVNLAASSAFGTAGTPIPLTLTTSLKDVDGSEEITTITLTGIPTGVTLNQGTLNADGSYTLTLAQLTGLTITTPVGFAGNFPVTMTINSREIVTDTDFDLTNNTAVNSTTFTVGVDFDAVPPTITVAGTNQVYEDNTIGVPITVVGNGTTDETMVVTIAGIPAGWTINAATLTGGTAVVTGTTVTVTLPANTNLGGVLTLTPPANSDVDSPSITITAVSTEPAVGDTATANGSFIVAVDAVADAPNLTVANATGAEDTAIPLTIASSLVDTDGSEALSIVISGLPTGATLSAGTSLGGGAWSVSPGQLAGLSLTPPVNFSGTIALTVTSTATETALNGIDFDLTNNVANTVRTLNVVVNPAADDPNLVINNAQVYEDQSVALNVTVAPTDTSEFVTVQIGNITGGWTVTNLNGGTFNAGTGVWSITLPVGATFTGGPTVAPPANSDVNRAFSVTAVSTDGTSTITRTGTLNVVVDAVADNVNLSSTGGSGAQGTPVALTVATSLIDTDGSEEITSITITGIPAGVTLSAGTYNAGTNSWTLTQGQLAGLTANSGTYSGTFTGTVTVNSRERVATDSDFDLTNNTAVNTSNFNVTFTPGAQPPVITVNGGAQGEVYEDSFVIVPVTVVGQGSNQETMVVTITNLPAGWAIDPSGLTGGTIAYTAGGSTITITLPANTDLGGSIRFAPPANSDGDASGIVITAVATEPSSATTATSNSNFTIVTDAVADQPNLTVTSTATGNEDTAIALTVSSSLVDTDGSETLSLRITGVPAGATLNRGTLNGDGSYTLTAAQLAGLAITPAANFAGTILLTVTANAHENATGATELTLANNDATRSANITVTVNPVADTPVVVVNNAQVYEDQSVTLNVTASSADPSEALTVQIGNLTGWTVTALNGGTYNAATGVWSITLAPGAAFAGGPTVAPPHDSDINRTLPVTVISTDGTSTTNVTGNLNVVVDAVADGVNVNAGDVSGNGTVPLTLNLSTSLKDVDGSEEITSIQLTGIPSGFTLSAGTNNGGGVWTLTQAQLAGLTITAPSGYSGSFTGNMVVNSREKVAVDSDFDNTNNTASNSDPFTVTIQGAAVPPTVSVGANQQVYEDNSVNVPITVVGNGSTNETLTITVTGIPAGWGVNTGGVGTYSGGVWTINLPANTNFSGSLGLTPPANSDVNSPSITVTAVAHEPGGSTANATGNFVVVVDAVADGVNINAGADVHGAYGATLSLNPSTSLKDTDGSEEITSITISGIPAGVTLNQGTNLGGGVWSLTAAQLAGLTINGGAYAGTFNATLTVNSRERVATDSDFDFGNNTASNSDSFTVTFDNQVLPPPTVDVQVGVGGSGQGSTYEDTAFTVPFSATYAGGDNDEVMTVVVSGIPTNWGVNTNGQGSYNAAAGTWTITLPAGTHSFNNTSLQLTPPFNTQGDLNLTVSASLSDPDNAGLSITDSAPLPIIVDAVVDGLDITPPASVDAYMYFVPGVPTDTSFAAPFGVTFRDNDGSETITSVQAIGPNAGYLTSVYYAGGYLGGTFSGAYIPPFDVTLRFTTYDNVQDGELTLSNNTMVQDVVVHFNPVTIYTPLALDLDGNGVEYRSINDGVTFDVNGDGTKEKTAWVGGKDALLAIDNNHDGLINNITELFGTDNGQHADGFAKLSTYDTDGDGKITAADSVFSELRLWTDTNGDGISQADELHGLLDFGIASINLNSSTVFEVVGRDTGVVTGRSTFTTTDGATHEIVDMSFAYEAHNDLTAAINEFVHNNAPDTTPAAPAQAPATPADTSATAGSDALAQLDDATQAAQNAA